MSGGQIPTSYRASSRWLSAYNRDKVKIPEFAPCFVSAGVVNQYLHFEPSF